jgi:hypothetical protein
MTERRVAAHFWFRRHQGGRPAGVNSIEHGSVSTTRPLPS